jgi:hypothetical protein
MRTSPEFADRLSLATVQKHYHPIEDVDWSHPFDLERFYLPERTLTIYGTEAYDRLTLEERKLLSLHEMVSYFSTGIWLENMLMYGFLYHLYAMDYADPDVRYMLHEVGDEANHSIMFHEFVRRAGLGYAPVTPFARFMGRLASRQLPQINPYLFFIGILIGEEPPDYFARAARQDLTLHPISRRIMEVHSIEEGRHIAYAREYLTRHFRGASAFRRLHARVMAPLAVLHILDEFYKPRWTTGYDAAPAHLRFKPETKALIDEWRPAPNPHRRALRRESLRRVIGFLEEIGAVTGVSRWEWRRMGLVDA